MTLHWPACIIQWVGCIEDNAATVGAIRSSSVGLPEQHEPADSQATVQTRRRGWAALHQRAICASSVLGRDLRLAGKLLQFNGLERDPLLNLAAQLP